MEATRSFSIWNSADTVVSFTLSSQSIKNGGSVSIITGKLTRLPNDPAYDLSGLPLTVTVTDPPEYGPPMIATFSTTTTDSAGHFTLSGISGLGGFRLEGTYTVTASFADVPAVTPVLRASSASLPVMVGSTAGYAIIVEGKLKDDPDRTTSAPYHNLSHSKTAQRVYEALKARGFADADIYNLNYDSTKQGVDAAPDKALVQTLLTATGATYGAGPFSSQSTIFTKMVNNPGPLYLVLVDHGDPGNFYIDTDSATVTISATELNQCSTLWRRHWLRLPWQPARSGSSSTAPAIPAASSPPFPRTAGSSSPAQQQPSSRSRGYGGGQHPQRRILSRGVLREAQGW